MLCIKCKKGDYSISFDVQPNKLITQFLCKECGHNGKRILIKNEKISLELHIPGYNYCGPGTNVVGRLNRNIGPVNELDKACMRHDIRYLLSHHGYTTETEADMAFLSDINKIHQKDSSISQKITIFFVKKIIKTKILFDTIFDELL